MTKTLCNLTLVMALIVVTLGALTRLLDAGLACPDWPGCYGQLIPLNNSDMPIADNAKAWMEMIHRYLASGLGVAILIIALKIQADKALSSVVKKLSLGLLALVIIQGLFGMLTVTMKLLPQVVTLHLLGGMAILALLFLLALQLRSIKSVRVPIKLKALALVVLILLSWQIALGGWTSSNYAGLACPDFPTCQQQWLPEMNLGEAFNITERHDHNYLGGGLLSAQSVVTIQVVHRIFALVLLLAIITLFVRLWSYSDVRIPAVLLLVLTIVQLGLGIANAVLLLPLSLALAHNTGAAILLLNVVYINYILLSKINSNNH